MIVAVTGLDREARIIARPDVMVVVGGGDSKALETRIQSALESSAVPIMSIGICGALSSELRVGDCVVATEIATEGDRIPTHPGWSRELLAQVPEALPVILAGTDSIVNDPAERSRLYGTTNAAAVDMESHVAARIARQRGLPFAAFRVVSDSAHQSLPPAALVAMSGSGKIDLPAVLRSIATMPSQIPALIRTAWEAEKAFRKLHRCRHVLDADVSGMAKES